MRVRRIISATTHALNNAPPHRIRPQQTAPSQPTVDRMCTRWEPTGAPSQPQVPELNLLSHLGVVRSHERPHVSQASPYSEVSFKTLKHAPAFPDSSDDLRSLHIRAGSTHQNHERHHRRSRPRTPR